MTLFDLVVVVGTAELLAAIAILTALAWPKRAGPRLTLRPGTGDRPLADVAPAYPTPAPHVVRRAPGAPPGAAVPGG
jgi:hypothetical protein